MIFSTEISADFMGLRGHMGYFFKKVCFKILEHNEYYLKGRYDII